MSSKKHINARKASLALLNRFDPQKQNVKDFLEPYLDLTDQRNLATDIIIGVIRNRELLDHLISTLSDVQIKRIENKLVK